MPDPFDAFNRFQWNLGALAEIFHSTQDSSTRAQLLVLGHQHSENLSETAKGTMKKVFHWDDFTLKQRLLGKMPRPVMKFNSELQAKTVLGELAVSGVSCFLVPEEDLAQYEKVPAVLLELTKEYLTIKPLVGNSKQIAYSNLLCGVSACVEFRQQTTTMTTTFRSFSMDRSVDFPQRFEVLDLHLVEQKRCYRFSEEQLNEFFIQFGFPDERTGIQYLVAHLASQLQVFPHFHNFNGNAHHLGNSLMNVKRTLDATGLFDQFLQSKTTEQMDERPLFDLYSVLCRYDLVLGNPPT